MTISREAAKAILDLDVIRIVNLKRKGLKIGSKIEVLVSPTHIRSTGVIPSCPFLRAGTEETQELPSMKYSGYVNSIKDLYFDMTSNWDTRREGEPRYPLGMVRVYGSAISRFKIENT